MALRTGMIFVVAVAALGVACAPTPPAPAAPAAPEPPARAPEAAPQPKRGGIFIFAQPAETPTLHPWKGSIELTRALGPVYDQLVRLDHREGFDFRRELEIKPGLSERWETADPTTYIFHLRKNVKWHDGQSFTADDVVYSLEAWTDAKVAPEPRRGAGALIDSVEKMDQSTVKVRTKRPSSSFLFFIAFRRNAFVLPKHAEEPGKTLVGTGPFKVARADVSGVVAVERNPDYYKPGQPYLDGGKILSGLDRSAQTAAFIGKGMDLIQLSDKAQFDGLKRQAADAKNTSFLGSTVFTMYMKQDRPPFNDVRVRRAAHLAIDRQGLINTVTFGLGKPVPTGGHPVQGYAIPEEELLKLPGWRQPKDQDIAEAKRLLAEAGYPNGFKVNIQSIKDILAAPILEAMAPQLQKVGIDAQVVLNERAVFFKNRGDGSFEAYVAAADTDPPIEGLTDFYHSKGTQNQAPINDPELDALIEEADRTLDPQKASGLYQRIQRLMLEKVYSIPNVALPAFTLWHPWVNGLNIAYSAEVYVPQWENLWLDVDKAPRRSLQ